MSYLSRLGIAMDQNHYQLGNTTHLFETYIKHGYLDKVKRVGDDTQGIDYKWGPRSLIEFPEENIAQFVAAVFPDRSVDALRVLLDRAAM
jgi:hypothetical protein